MYRYLRFPGGKAKAVTLSYDDGVHQDKKFAERITKSGLKCTFNLNSRKIRDEENQISDADIKELILGKGHEIAVHGLEHFAPGAVRPIDGIADVLDCRRDLEQRFGIIVRGMAYPNSGVTWFENGTTYETVRNYLKSLDIKYARTLAGDNNRFRLPEDWYAWMPTAHHNNPDIIAWIEEFVSIDKRGRYFQNYGMPRLFYLWGHTYEFDRDNNWELLDEICEKLGGKDNIWYATNGEIYDYTEAYRSLSFSADGKIVYNPTLFELWFETKEKIYSIKPGETLHI